MKTNTLALALMKANLVTKAEVERSKTLEELRFHVRWLISKLPHKDHPYAAYYETQLAYLDNYPKEKMAPANYSELAAWFPLPVVG